MYPNVCAGGYPTPFVKKGNSIVAISVPALDTTKATRLTLLDDVAINDDGKIGKIRASDWVGNTKIVDLKGIASEDGTLDWTAPEPIRVRNAVSVVNADNTVAGSIFVYIK